jgi:hypothetical protein
LIYNNATVEATRGDTVIIPIQVPIPGTATVKSQIRQEADSVDYYELTIDGTNVIIPASISELLLGNYVTDIQFTLGSVVTTVQRTNVYFYPDVTR